VGLDAISSRVLSLRSASLRLRQPCCASESSEIDPISAFPTGTPLFSDWAFPAGTIEQGT